MSAFLAGEFGPGVSSLLGERNWEEEEEEGEEGELSRRGEQQERLRAELERIVGGQEVRQKGRFPFIASLKVKVGSSSGARK